MLDLGGSDLDPAAGELATRGFCPECGTPIAFKYDGDTGPAIAVGTLDHPEDWPPTWEHSGIESKVPWYEICDELPQTITEESEFLQDARDRKASAPSTSSQANEGSE